jgi:hypothetical protein
MTDPDARQPWARPGWRAEMTAWIDDRLADAGIRRRGEPTEVRVWDRSALLTIDTDRGRLWAKAVPELFSHEIAVTELLFDIDPGIVPPVVAADRTLGRIITEHVDGPSLRSLGESPDVWAATMSRLAELQRVLAADPAALAVAGVVAAPLGHLAEQIPRLLADDALLRVGLDGGLTRLEASAVRRRGGELVDACHALAASGIPDSLEHGDLAADEVIVGEMGPVFLDWSDGTIAHPFLSAASLLGAGPGGSGTGHFADVREGAYLGPWLTAGIGLTEVTGRAALAAARMVLPIHLAALYADRILPGVGPGSALETVVPDAMRTLLAR